MVKKTSLNENYVVPYICLRAIWHMHGSMWRATRMTRDRKRIIVAHCVIALWRHYCLDRVEGHFSGYPSHKTYTCQYYLLCFVSKRPKQYTTMALALWHNCYTWSVRNDSIKSKLQMSHAGLFHVVLLQQTIQKRQTTNNQHCAR